MSKVQRKKSIRVDVLHVKRDSEGCLVDVQQYVRVGHRTSPRYSKVLDRVRVNGKMLEGEYVMDGVAVYFVIGGPENWRQIGPSKYLSSDVSDFLIEQREKENG